MGAIYKACSKTENITKLTEKNNLILQTGFMGQFCNILQRQLTQAFRNSRTLDQQLERLHGTELGLLYVGDSCVGWCL